jgi:hypothetical protein
MTARMKALLLRSKGGAGFKGLLRRAAPRNDVPKEPCKNDYNGTRNEAISYTPRSFVIALIFSSSPAYTSSNCSADASDAFTLK